MANERASKGQARPKQGEASGGYGRKMNLALFVMAILATLSLLWIGAESHYRSCIAAAEAKNTVEVLQSPKGSSIVGQGGRRDAVDDCSRLPF